MRQLVPADGDQVGPAEQDVRRLVHGIGEHQAADGGLPRVRDLVLDRGVAAEFRDRDQAQERQQQLVELGHGAVVEDHRPLGVDPGREVVQQQPLDVLAEPLGDVPVGEHLVVGDDQEQLHAQPLEPDPVLQGAEVVAQVQLPGRPVPGEHPEPARFAADEFLQLGAAALGGGSGIGGGIGSGRIDGGFDGGFDEVGAHGLLLTGGIWREGLGRGGPDGSPRGARGVRRGRPNRTAQGHADGVAAPRRSATSKDTSRHARFHHNARSEQPKRQPGAPPADALTHPGAATGARPRRRTGGRRLRLPLGSGPE